MNPFEHGEVFVTDDGGETDLDLGHYERFIDENLSRELERHHRLDLPGRARRRAPGRLPRQHRAGDPAHHRRDQAAHPAGLATDDVDVVITEVGGTVGDIEILPVPRGDPAVPQGRRAGTTSATSTSPSCPFIGPSGEQKTKPTQHSVTELRSRGIQPDAIVCRSERAHQRRPQAQDLEPLRRRGARRRQRRRRPQPLRDPARSCTRRASTTSCATCSRLDGTDRPRRRGRRSSTGSRRPTDRCGSA